MVQIYFLSIFLNILAGLVLVCTKKSSEDIMSEEHGFDIEDSFISNDIFKLVTGAGCTVIGLIKLFFCFSLKSKAVPILGDLFPSVMGMAGGLTILLEYYLNYFSQGSVPQVLDTVLLKNKFYIGIACMCAAVLHFIIPGVILF